MRIALIFLCLAGSLPAQPIAVGVKAGAQLTNDMETYFATSETKRYVIGPMVTAKLPLGFRFEFDALYRRAGYRVFSSDTFGIYTAVYRGNSWEFPLLVRHHIVHGIYGGVGYAGHVIHGGGHYNFSGLGASFSQGDVQGDWDTTHGVVGAAGVEKHVGPLHVAPEVRYTYWNHPAVQVYGPRGFSVVSSQHQVDLMIGLTFP